MTNPSKKWGFYFLDMNYLPWKYFLLTKLSYILKREDLIKISSDKFWVFFTFLTYGSPHQDISGRGPVINGP